MGNYIGKTRIELQNIHTGRMEKIEHGNVFKGENIQKYLKTHGVFDNHYRTAQPLWQDVVGGIMLFESAIPTNTNIIPAGHKMIANGAYDVLNSGSPNELGSWNATESSISEDGSTIVLVYDWTTSQGNGDIACIGLTSYVGGYCGIGNPSGGYTTAVGFLKNRLHNNGVGNTAIGKDKRIAVKSVAETTLTLWIQDLFSEHAVLAGGESSYSKDITIAQRSFALNTINSRLRQLTKNIVALISVDGSLEPGENMYVDLINTNTWEVTSKTIQNVTTDTFGFNEIMILSENEIVPVTTNDTSTHYIINLDTGTFSKINIEHTGSSVSLTGSSYMVNENLILMPKELVGGGSNYSMWDRVNNTFYPINTNTQYQLGTSTIYDSESNAWISVGSGCMTNNPYYLATINNLENPVTKDVSKTMKVIYTLTKAS